MAEVEDNGENFQICLDNCGKCPSYPDIEDEALYCARGRSSAQIQRNGCSCPDCPLWVTCGLSGTYYCDR